MLGRGAVVVMARRYDGSAPPGSDELCLLRTTGARDRCLHGEHLTRSWPVEHAGRAVPFGGHHEQRSPVRAPERTGEAPAVEIDRLQHLATLANAHAPLVRDVRVPD